ncbi:MAG TPA: sigma 54-interacting transcriptional regulator [Terriglobales bacterium]|jgi:PAS domain S-box-containing protein|nr:sigma 54-interacting transcriptional regulator [Terriglobales bacterium]
MRASELFGAGWEGDSVEVLWRDAGCLFCKLRRNDAESEIHAFIPLSAAASVDHATLETVNRLTHEYELKSYLDSAWALRPLELVRERGQTMLLVNYTGGEPLDRLLLQPMEIGRFLRLSAALSSAVGQLHGRGLIHKDIKPANVLVDSATGRVQLTGFGIASRLPRERQSPEPPEFIAGTLAYMSPEQTGRVNRSIDSRSDLYSLGVTLYQMLTGSLPFNASDPMEWVHCHIARQPTAPRKRIPNVPEAVSALTMKLLSKTAEERYQTAAGVERDLLRCLSQWESRRSVDTFTLGAEDTSDCLMIPERLYGRAREVDGLLAAFDRIVAGGRPEMVLVSGYSGIGKSAVVNELHKPLVPPRGLFASGKFDQYKRDIPYATLAQAFQSLVRPLLSKGEDELRKWRYALQEALEPNGLLIVDLVPELKHVIGEQPPIPELPPSEAQRRFQLVFRRFIGVFARPEHPLALFLDDLQWLDAATLDLMEDLLTGDDLRHLLLIGAYRDNEVSATHPLMRKLDAIRHGGAAVEDIVLTPLGQDDLCQLLMDSLHCEPVRAAPLAKLTHEKTTGNPFFAIQFISALADEALLSFDYGEGRWVWDLNGIHAKGYTDNVVQLMVGKLNRLPLDTQKALQEFACMGNSAEFEMLRMVYQESVEDMHDDLWEAVRSGLIFRGEDSYRFLHDRVQEAAYSLIPKELRAETHLRIGMLLAAHTPPAKREEAIFEIVNQLNRGSHLIHSVDERERVADLNLIAAKRAKSATAYDAALKFLRAASTLLTEETWERKYELMFSLEYLMAECELLTAEKIAAENRMTRLAERARNRHDFCIATRLRLTLYTTLDRSDGCAEVFVDWLRRDGAIWSIHPTRDDVMREYERIWALLGDRTIEELIDLPRITDPDVLDTLDVFTEIMTPSQLFDENLSSLVLCRMVTLSLEHGNCDASCFAYVWLAMFAGPRFNNYKDGFRFGQLGYDLVEKRGLTRYQARIWMNMGSTVLPWMKHPAGGRDLVRRAFDLAYRIGDLTFASYSWDQLVTVCLAVGDPLAEVETECENGLAFAKRVHFGLVIELCGAQLGLIRTLRGLTPRFGSLDHEEYNELDTERRLALSPNLAFAEFYHWTRKLQARFFAGNFASAVDASLNAEAERLLWTSAAMFESAEHRFYGALAHAAAWDSASPEQRPKHLESLLAHYRQLQVWAELNPDTFVNRAALVAAEIARIEGRTLEAEELYEKAIRSAHANGFLHNEGVANEVAGRFYSARGFEKIATTYLREARYCYLRWGADAKVRQLEQLYPQIGAERSMSDATPTIHTPVGQLELATVIKVSEAVSSEIVAERLIDTIMRTALEHAGAERGLLVLPRGDGYRIEAEATTSSDEVTVILRQTSASAADLPSSVLHYVLRTKEGVRLHDASGQNSFAADEYFRGHHARSVLCLPLLKQTRLLGVLYLENNLTPHAFTSARMAVLKLLASAAAISMENTRLYSDLEDREARIRRLVEANILGIVTWNLDGAILASNEAFLRMVQYSHEDVAAGRVRWWEMTPADWRERAERALAEVIQTGTVQPFESEFFRKDGTRMPVLIGATLFQDGGRDGVAFALDLSKQKEAEAEIRALKDQLYRENLALRDEVDRAQMFEEIVGCSKPLKTVLSRIAKVAPTDSTVLITGETGTGKELIARAVHKRSQRAGRAFVSVNCAALAPTLISSELFGHEKGAFTGATQRRLGRFEQANGGTIFLDEVGELPADTQVALLRVLQEREFERVGGAQTIRVDVRLITATNRDLTAAVANGSFRQDLFYRLNVFPIEVPPLRDRTDDILMLVEYFVRRYAKLAGKSFHSIDKKTLALLRNYDWPGNIRELQNVIERSVILNSGNLFIIDESWLTKQTVRRPKGDSRVPSQGELHTEREIIEAALVECRGRVAGRSGAAAKLGVPPSTLDHRIKALHIDKTRFKFR